MKRSIFFGMSILSEHKWITNHAVIVEDGKIKAIVPENMIKHHLPAKQYQYPGNHYLVPGFIDVHVHGAKGKDVMDGDHTSLKVISEFLVAEGVTGFLATTMTADNDRLENVLKNISQWPSKTGAALLGIHLEGPFIAKEKIGAHQEDKVKLPDPLLIQAWQRLSKGAIKIATIAPELPGAEQLIAVLRSMGIIVSIGHTNATYEEGRSAIKNGCSQATHLFNAMRGLHQREPGVLGAILLAANVSAELVVDGFHLHPAIVELAFKIKGKGKLLLVTDAIRTKCLGDGSYNLDGQTVQVKNGQSTLEDGRIAGSSLCMNYAIKNMVSFAGCSLIEAIEMATENPAHILGLTDHKGSILIGKDADLVVLNENLDVMMTMRDGQEVYNARHEAVL